MDLIDRQAAIDALEREQSLDERPITETRWFDFGLRKAQDILSELPSAQPDVPDTNVGDMISRQVAIDALTHKWDGMVTSVFDVINSLPSAQPEIIRCKECKFHSHDAGYGHDWCNRMSGVFRVQIDDFCSRAERRTNG